jgi:hypothetical protein
MFPKDVKINFPKFKITFSKKKKNCIHILFSKMAFTNVLDSSEGFQILLTQV